MLALGFAGTVGSSTTSAHLYSNEVKKSTFAALDQTQPSSHSSVSIVGNSEFTAANGVTGGTGTVSDPFIISGWDINVSQSAWHGQYYNGPYPGIGVSNTNAYFVITGVSIHGLVCVCDGADTIGINLINVTNARIESSGFADLNQDVYAFAANVTITGNAFSVVAAFTWRTGSGEVGNPCISVYGPAIAISGNTFSQCPSGEIATSSGAQIGPNISLNGGLDQMTAFDNAYVSLFGNFTANTTSKSLSGTVSLAAAWEGIGAPVFRTFSVNTGYGKDQTAKFVLSIPSIPGISSLLAASCKVNVTSNTASCLVSGNPDDDNDGSINIIDVATAALSYDSQTGDSRFVPSCDLDKNGRIDISDVAIIAADYEIPVLN